MPVMRLPPACQVCKQLIGMPLQRAAPRCNRRPTLVTLPLKLNIRHVRNRVLERVQGKRARREA